MEGGHKERAKGWVKMPSALFQVFLFPGFTELTLESKHSLRAFVWNNLVFCEGFYNEIFCPNYL